LLDQPGRRLPSSLLHRLTILVAAAALVSVGVGSAATGTKLEQWVAFRASSPAPGVHVLLRARGSCVAPSLADPRSDAWRCIASREVEDPCFSDVRGGPFVLCPDGTPDSRDAIRLMLTRPLPARHAGSPRTATEGDPWVIETGARYCYRVTAAAMVLASRRLTYECAGAAALAGRPHRTAEAWTILLLPANSSHFTSVAISSAWW